MNTQVSHDEKINVAFSFKKELPKYLVGVDDHGIERWFDRSKYECWVQLQNDPAGRDPILMVRLTTKEWEKRQQAVEPKEVVFTKARKCLCCSTTFQAEKHMFVCDPCKATTAWKTGGGSYSVSL